MARRFNYSAYISYAPEDAFFARRLHRSLETYDIPRQLVQTDPFEGPATPKSLYPIFRDRRDLHATILSEEAQQALAESSALILVASPNSLANARVRADIERFLSLDRPIFTIIPDDAPFGEEASFGPAAQYTPQALHGAPVIALDARRGKDGFRNAALALAANLIGAPSGALIEYDKNNILRRGAWKDIESWSLRGAMNALFSVLSVVVAALSVVSLVRFAADVGLREALQTLLDSYDHLVSLALDPARPFIESVLRELNRWMHWDLHLFEHWKHVLVLLLVYFNRDQGAGGWIKRPGGTIFFLIIALPIAVAISIGAGCIDPAMDAWAAGVLAPITAAFAFLGFTQYNAADVLIAMIAVVGVGLYDYAKLFWYALFLIDWHAIQQGVPKQSTWRFILRYVRYPTVIFLSGMLIAFAAPQVSFIRDLKSPGLAVVLLLILGLALYWLFVGGTRVKRVREADDSWLRAYRRSGPGLLGLWMLVVFLGAVVFFALNSLPVAPPSNVS